MKIKTNRKKYPKGWDIISPTLEEFNIKMREAENDPHEGKRKTESHWAIFRIHHQRSRYIYELFYKSKTISRELYEFCLNEGIADKNLIAKWKKPGYGYLCCLRCIQDLSHVCICRVPPKGLIKKSIIECVSCGCKGCSGASTKTIEEDEEEEEEQQDNQKQQQQVYSNNNKNNNNNNDNEDDEEEDNRNKHNNKNSKKEDKEDEDDN